VARDTAGVAAAIYTKSSCLSLGGTSVFALAMDDRSALPPSLTAGLSNDSMLRVRVTDATGRLLWASDTGTADLAGVVGEAVWPRLGDLRVRVFIRPAIAESLVIGGLPPSRLPAAAFLLVLAAAFAAFAILQIRRHQELIRLRERFVSNITHELRTPLQQILVFTELLRMNKLRTDEERRHSIEVVERETHRLIQLVDNVLRFSRADRGEDVLVDEAVDVVRVARETLQAFTPLAATTDANVILQADGTAIARADAGAVRRVLLNLLDNAVKYGPRGQTITVAVHERQGKVIVSIEDEGPGVPAPDRERVWQPFRRLDRDEGEAVAGSGMGLAIVHDLTRRMGGVARIEDSPGGGARFVVELPAAAP
jgi:signal transduction histidine kinase